MNYSVQSSSSQAKVFDFISFESLQLFTLLAAINMIAMIFWLGDSQLATQTFSFTPPLDKLLHAVVFCAMAFFLRFSGLIQSATFVFLLMAGVGALDEIHQIYIPLREASIKDFAADLVGISLGILLSKPFVRLIRGY